VNYFLSLVGVRGPGWTGDPAWALWSIVLADAWQNTPFVILVVYAGLQSIPEEPLEAAMVDGASRSQTLAHVIYPFLRPLVLFVLIIRSMDAFRIFDQVFVMTGGGPGTTTQTITFYNYVMAFRMLRMGRASALGVITLLILSVVIGLWIYLLYRREKGEWCAAARRPPCPSCSVRVCCTWRSWPSSWSRCSRSTSHSRPRLSRPATPSRRRRRGSSRRPWSTTASSGWRRRSPA